MITYARMGKKTIKDMTGTIITQLGSTNVSRSMTAHMLKMVMFLKPIYTHHIAYMWQQTPEQA
jgi:hypothetical protein